MYITSPLSGSLGAAAPSAAVKRLQTSLTQLAALVAQPAINPGKVDGIVGPQTVSATAAALRVISPKLPKQALRTSMEAISLAIPFVPNVEQHITARADEISSAINIIIATADPAAGPVAPAVPWWQTTAGRGGLLAFAGVLTVVLVMKKYRSGPAPAALPRAA